MTTSHSSTTAAGAGDALYSLVYSSFATESFDDTQLQDLLTQSRRANTEHEITGMLLYRRGRFIQFLEGPEDRVRALVARISVDTRHQGVRVMLDGHPESREFPEWTMGYEPVNEPTGPAPDGFRSTFDDLENVEDTDSVLRATRELSFWFRVRAGGR